MPGNSATPPLIGISQVFTTSRLFVLRRLNEFYMFNLALVLKYCYI